MWRWRTGIIGHGLGVFSLQPRFPHITRPCHVIHWRGLTDDYHGPYTHVDCRVEVTTELLTEQERLSPDSRWFWRSGARSAATAGASSHPEVLRTSDYTNNNGLSWLALIDFTMCRERSIRINFLFAFPPPSIFVLVLSEGLKPSGHRPRFKVNFNHCARFVFLSRAVD